MPVVLFVAALFLFLLFLRVRLVVRYETDISLEVKVAFFTYRMKEKKKGKAKKKKEPPGRKETVGKFLRNFGTIMDLLKTTFRAALKRVRIDHFDLELIVGGEDAAGTAIEYGEACACIFPAVSFLERHVKIKRKRVSVRPAFDSTPSSLRFRCVAGIRIGSAFAVAFLAGFAFLRSILLNAMKKKRQVRGQA